MVLNSNSFCNQCLSCLWDTMKYDLGPQFRSEFCEKLIPFLFIRDIPKLIFLTLEVRDELLDYLIRTLFSALILV
jgi:hypothetical protein